MKNFLLIAAFATTTFAASAQVTSLHEDFNVCDTTDINGAHPTGWTTYNTTGAQLWKWYNRYGTHGSPCMGINGYATTNFANKDYLITPKMNLSGYAGTVTFNFYQKSNFYGDSLGVKYSTNYTGSGDPASATWTAMPAINNTFDTNKYVSYKGYSCNVTSIKSTPFYVAFIYTSTTADGRLIDLDSVFTDTVVRQLTSPWLGVENINNSQINTPVIVLGNPTSNSMALEFTAAEAGAFVVTVTDMSGRKVATKAVNAVTGQNFITISDMNAVPGFYIVDVRNETSFGVTKTVIR